MAHFRWDLPYEVSAIRDGRRLAVAAATAEMARAGTKSDIDAVELLASELLTNAVVHGEPPIRLDLDTDDGATLRLAVDDGSMQPPVPAKPSTRQIGGWGLAFVESLSTRWGWEFRSNGKRVWCELRPGSQAEESPAT